MIDVKEPCSANWASMCGDDTSRFCASCEKRVHNLSGLRREGAERLLRDAASPICIRFVRDERGAVKTLDDRTGPAIRSAIRRVVAAVLPACLATAFGLSGCARPTQGKMAVAPHHSGAANELLGEAVVLGAAYPQVAPAPASQPSLTPPPDATPRR